MTQILHARCWTRCSGCWVSNGFDDLLPEIDLLGQLFLLAAERCHRSWQPVRVDTQKVDDHRSHRNRCYAIA